jgi:hypothetical protein
MRANSSNHRHVQVSVIRQVSALLRARPGGGRASFAIPIKPADAREFYGYLPGYRANLWIFLTFTYIHRIAVGFK